MSQFLRKIKHDAFTLISVLFGLVKNIDYKALNTYILAINQTTSLENILFQASICLKDILQYRLFAFVLRDQERLDCWVDPDLNIDLLKKRIAKDFNLDTPITVNLMNKKKAAGTLTVEFHSEDLISYELIYDSYAAKIYLVPQRRPLPYHNEIMGTILATIRIAVSNYMSIKKLETEAAIDPLTGCVNRRELARLMKGQMANAARYRKHLSILMFDIDHFKAINDTYGHHAGDMVLKGIAGFVSNEIRSGDVIARYGGEEFIVILPETQKQKAIELAERLRKVIETKVIVVEKKAITVTASFGVASAKGHQDISALINEADAMLYKAKTSGRNRVIPGLMRLCEVQKEVI